MTADDDDEMDAEAVLEEEDLDVTIDLQSMTAEGQVKVGYVLLVVVSTSYRLVWFRRTGLVV